MVEVTLLQDSEILIPNKTHENFTSTRKVIPEGTILTGGYHIIKGKRRGEPFNYRLFKIAETNNYIKTKQTKPNQMEKTEVTLGADAQQSATQVNVPSNKLADRTPIIAAIVGGIVGFGVAKAKKIEGNKKLALIAVMAFGSYFVGKMIVKRRGITVKASK